jgi:hypothetical protein
MTLRTELFFVEISYALDINGCDLLYQCEKLKKAYVIGTFERTSHNQRENIIEFDKNECCVSGVMGFMQYVKLLNA